MEPFGLDECWLYITGSTHLYGDGLTVADENRNRVKEELGVTVSVGVSFNKIFAKLGSDYKKPDAVTAFTRENFRDLVWPLPVSDLLYVGRATTRKLTDRGIYTIGELAGTDLSLLQSWFGKVGLILSCFANGMDTSPVMRCGDETIIKSIGNSTTTPRDLVNELDAKIVFYMLSESVAERLRDHGFLAKTVQISVRDNGLFWFQRQMALKEPSCLSSELCDTAMELLRKSYRWQNPLRSIGIRGCDLIPATSPKQLKLFEDEASRYKQEKLKRTVDDIRRRFGHYSIYRAFVESNPTLKHISPKDEHTIHPVGYLRRCEDRMEQSVTKTYVTVTVQISPDGSKKPLRIILEDGRSFDIDELIDVRRAASLKAGGCGIRYSIRIGLFHHLSIRRGRTMVCRHEALILTVTGGSRRVHSF